MSRVVQIAVGQNNSLIALTDDGKIFARRIGIKDNVGYSYWDELDLPECCESQLSFAPTQDTSRIPTPVPRRPTSIGSDGKYIPPLGD